MPPDLDGIYETGTPFLQAVWSLQPSGYYCVVFRTYDPEEWYTMWFDDDSVDEAPHEFPDECDIYWCPAAYRAPRRTKDNVLPSRWLWADLDYTRPEEASILPTVSWETSPDKFQALWLLPRILEADEFGSLNKALCYSSGADPGTWNVNRLLRVPGTVNQKYRRRKKHAVEA